MAKNKEIVFKTDIDNSKSIKSINQMEEELAQMKESIKDIGDTSSVEFKKMSKEISKSEAKLKDLNKSFEGLDTDARAGELGKLAGGLGAVGTAAALAFSDNEDIEKFFQTFAQGLAITNAVKGGIEAYTASIKLLRGTTVLQTAATTAMSAAQSIYATVVGTTTGALKLFRIALAATGIGAIAIAIGALVANFQDIVNWVKKTIDRFEFLQVAIKPLVFLFDLIKKGLQELGIIDDEQTNKAIANAQARIDNAEKERAKIGSNYDFEIAKARAAGENTYKLEQDKRRAILETIKTQAEAIAQQVRLTGEFTDEQRDALKNLKDLAIKTSREIKVAEISDNKERKDDWKKTNEKKIKDNEEHLKKLKDADKTFRDLQTEFLIDSRSKAEEIERNKIDDRIKALREKGPEYIEAAAFLESQKEEAVKKAGDEWQTKKDEEKSKKDKDDESKEKEKAQKGLDALKLANDTEIQQLINKGATEDEINAEIKANRKGELEFQRENDLISQEEYENQVIKIDNESKKRQADNAEKLKQARIAAASDTASALGSIGKSIDQLAGESTAAGKALGIAQIGISSAVAIAGAVKGGSELPFPANIAAIATGIATVIGNIATAKNIISGVKVPKGGGSGLPSGFGGIGGSSGFVAPTPPSLTDLGGGPDVSTEENELGVRQTQNQQRVYVLESDISNAQASVLESENEAKLQ